MESVRLPNHLVFGIVELTAMRNGLRKMGHLTCNFVPILLFACSISLTAQNSEGGESRVATAARSTGFTLKRQAASGAGRAPFTVGTFALAANSIQRLEAESEAR